jgi:upstream activation factor subunit UAF30
MEDLAKEITLIRRDVRKILKFLDDPTGEKSKKRSENNGFKKPLKVSDELRTLLGLGPDDLISRSEVTTKINEYAKEHNLKNGQELLMNDALRSLLSPPEGLKVTFMNLQTYLNRHYIKDTPAVPPAGEVVPEEVKPKKPRVTKK